MVEEFNLWKFVAPVFVFSVASLRPAGRWAKNIGGRKVSVISDVGVMAAGWMAEVFTCLDEAGGPHSLFEVAL
jgi:alcohol dehydrogenase class IV